MRFFLGTHKPVWFKRTDVPLFLSRRRLAEYARVPAAQGPWALDSGGFTELTLYDKWVTPQAQYIEEVYRFQAEAGRMDWAAPQDWMCEPHMLDKTGLSIEEHQQRTVASVLQLRQAAPDLPFIPVLQGWEMDDYWRCIELYQENGVDLRDEPIVGLGSVCRRQATSEIGEVVTALHGHGIALHGFGVKKAGLQRYGHMLASADSMAWSYAARREAPLPTCTHPRCNNCMAFALDWRQRLLDSLGSHV